MASAGSKDAATVAVWSVPQRVCHLAFIVGVTTAWFAGEAYQRVHDLAGYLALTAAVARILIGVWGGPHARFTAFVRRPRAVRQYARTLLAGREQRYLGHNPLGGWMVIALLIALVVTCTTGALFTTDAFWGLAWLEQLHRASAWTVVGLVGVHVTAAVWMSLRHRENLVGAMVSGKKRPER